MTASGLEHGSDHLLRRSQFHLLCRISTSHTKVTITTVGTPEGKFSAMSRLIDTAVHTCTRTVLGTKRSVSKSPASALCRGESSSQMGMPPASDEA